MGIEFDYADSEFEMCDIKTIADDTALIVLMDASLGSVADELQYKFSTTGEILEKLKSWGAN